MTVTIVNTPGSDNLTYPETLEAGEILRFNWTTGDIPWTPPTKGIYKVTAAGARGLNNSGFGAIIEGLIELSPKDIVVLKAGKSGNGGVGGSGGNGRSTDGGSGGRGGYGGNGGAGSAIKLLTRTILAAAGGGGFGGYGGSAYPQYNSGYPSVPGKIGGDGGVNPSSNQNSKGGLAGYGTTKGVDGSIGLNIYDGHGGGGGSGGRGEDFIATAGNPGNGGSGGKNIIESSLFVSTSVYSASNTGDGYIEIVLIESLSTNLFFIKGEEGFKEYVSSSSVWEVLSEQSLIQLLSREEGMNDLSILCRKVQVVESVTVVKNDPSSEGEILRATADLAKYFDLRGLNINAPKILL